MKNIFVFTFLTLAPIALFAQSDKERAKEFLNESKQLRIAERIDRAEHTIKNSDDDIIVAEAIWDLAQFWHDLDDELRTVELLLERSPSTSRSYQRARMAKARILARMGKKNEAHLIFEDAIGKGWDQSLHFYHNSLWETGDYDKIALDAYKRLSALNENTTNSEYQGEQDFTAMLDSLRALRAIDPNASAMQLIEPHLRDSQSRPLARKMAKAVCLAVDDRYTEALEVLDDAKILAKNEEIQAFDESENLLFLRAAILFLEGRDFDAARLLLKEYMDVCADHKSWALSRILFLNSRAFEHSYEDAQKMLELTTLLIGSDYVTNKELEDEFHDWQLSGVWGAHQKALAYRGRWKDSALLCIKVMDEYYPHTMAGANTALGLALYVSWHDHNQDGAERILRDILKESPFDGVAPHVLLALANLADKRGDRKEALSLLEEIFDRIGTLPYGRVPTIDTRQNALKLMQKIMQQ